MGSPLFPANYYPQQISQPQTQPFMPSFQSSLSQSPVNPGAFQYDWSTMSDWNSPGVEVAPSTGPLSPSTLSAINQARQPVPMGSYFPGGTGTPGAGTNGQGIDAVALAQYGNAPRTAAAMGRAVGTANWRGVPINQMTGDQYKAMLADTQPSNAGAYAQMGLQGVQMAGQLGLGIASLVQGQEAFNKQMAMADRNYAAQSKLLGNALADKIRGKYTRSYYEAHKNEIDAEIEGKKPV